MHSSLLPPHSGRHHREATLSGEGGLHQDTGQERALQPSEEDTKCGVWGPDSEDYAVSQITVTRTVRHSQTRAQSPRPQSEEVAVTHTEVWMPPPRDLGHQRPHTA